MTALPLPGMGLPQATAPQPAAARRRVDFDVQGEPRGMGSKSAFVITPKEGGKPRAIITDAIDKNPQGAAKMKSWKDSVTTAAMMALGDGERMLQPLAVEVVFRLRRPAGHYTPKGLLGRSAPPRPSVKPDLDKLVRSTMDALKVVLISDDSRIVRLIAEKRYAELTEPTGAHIVVEELG